MCIALVQSMSETNETNILRMNEKNKRTRRFLNQIGDGEMAARTLHGDKQNMHVAYMAIMNTEKEKNKYYEEHWDEKSFF